MVVVETIKDTEIKNYSEYKDDKYYDWRMSLKHRDKVVGVVIHDGGMNLNIDDGYYCWYEGSMHWFGFDRELYMRQMDLRYIFPDRDSARKGAADCVRMYSIWKYKKITQDCQELIDMCELKWGDKI